MLIVWACLLHSYYLSVLIVWACLLHSYYLSEPYVNLLSTKDKVLICAIRHSTTNSNLCVLPCIRNNFFKLCAWTPPSQQSVQNISPGSGSIQNMFRQDREEFRDWKIVKCLGSGGNGEVLLWRNRPTRQKIAIKALKFPPGHDDEKDRQRWRDEIAFAKQIRHENIVHAITVQPEEFTAYLSRRYPPEPLIMEYCEGGDLRKKLNKTENINGMSEAEVRNILKCLKNAIIYMHSKGITHRDIKPENLVITEVNGNEVYKLTDLGYAREISSTIEASHVGTFEYFAPEVITEPSYSNTVDYWSLGVIAFEIICGTRPFLPGCPMMDFIQKIKSKSFEDIAITKSPETNEFQYHKRLFDQNRISSWLKQLMERWLRIPLAVNPRLRAVSAENVTNPPISDVEKKTVQPTDLKIFRDLENILTAKILTVFCLHNFRIYSYPIADTTSRQGFLETLSLDTSVDAHDIVIILPTENQNISRFLPNNQPIELYVTDLFEKPMVYCSTDKETLKESSQNVGMSPLLLRAVEDNSVKNRKHGIQVAKHMLFYVQLQGDLACNFLQGLLNYAVMVDDWIVKYQAKVDDMASMFWQLHGTIQFYLLQVDHAKRMLSEKDVATPLEDKSDQVVQRFKRIRELFSRTRNRFVSVLRRSKCTIGELNGNFNSYLANVDQKTEISALSDVYNKLRDDTGDSFAIIASDMFKHFNRSQDKIWFLHSPQVKHIQATISEIHVEFELIEKVVEGLLKEQIDTMQLMNQLASSFGKSLWDLATTANDCDENGDPNIPDLADIWTNSQVNKINEEASDCCYSRCNGIEEGDWSIMSPSEEAQSIVDENSLLVDSVAELLKKRVFDDPDGTET